MINGFLTLKPPQGVSFEPLLEGQFLTDADKRSIID
jgi:hypothetical protein